MSVGDDSAAVYSTSPACDRDGPYSRNIIGACALLVSASRHVVAQILTHSLYRHFTEMRLKSIERCDTKK